jgi:hypothetical protein
MTHCDTTDQPRANGSSQVRDFDSIYLLPYNSAEVERYLPILLLFKLVLAKIDFSQIKSTTPLVVSLHECGK